jgi:hypothetical protein
MDYPNIEAVLSRLGLSKAVRGVPALPAVVIICVGVSYVSLPAISILSGLPRPVFYLMTVVVGTVMALIGLLLGQFLGRQSIRPTVRSVRSLGKARNSPTLSLSLGRRSRTSSRQCDC